MMKTIAWLLSLCLVILVAADAAAAEMAYSIGTFAWPGMSLAKLRSKVPPGLRLICGTDREVASVAENERHLLEVPPELAKAGVDHCAVFSASSASKSFQIQQIQLGDSPAEFGVLILVDANGVQRVAQIDLAQSNREFANTIAYFTQTYGDPTKRSTTSAQWKNSRNEALMLADDKGNLKIGLIDAELQLLLNERIAAGQGHH